MKGRKVRDRDRDQRRTAAWIALGVGLVTVIVVAAVVALAARDEDEPPVVITHWANSHLMRDGLLPDMAEAFNAADHETASGRPIEVVVVSCDSSVQSADLVSRVRGAGPAPQHCADGDGGPAIDPTIVTPQSGDWLVDVNHSAGREVVDHGAAPHLAETWLGIVTYRSMAACLGWPEKELGYADILALRADPDGWAAHPDCARTEWGRRPLLAFTNPSTSTSGRNVLVSLYSIAAGKPPADLTVADIERPEVIEYVQEFQQLVDHYLPGTIPLNTKIAQGPRYGHFFLMPEDNLVSLQQGNEKAIAPDGSEQPIPAVADLVMIYPREGAVLNSNPAGIVHAPWVTDGASAAAAAWIEFVRAGEQQHRFAAAGFRPAGGTGVRPDAGRFAAWGLDVEQPRATIEPGDLAPDVLARITGSWGAVKNPAVVTFVVDVSGSMRGAPLAEVKDGLGRILDVLDTATAQGADHRVGLVTFASTVEIALAPAPFEQARYDIADAVARMHAAGDTALFSAVRRAVHITDDADGDPRATRAVVVLSDGAATAGMCLDDLVTMVSQAERPISRFCAVDTDYGAVDADGQRVAISDVHGETLAIKTDHDVQVFFLGFGAADIAVGRILAQATGAEYQGSADEDLAAVVEDVSGYF